MPIKAATAPATPRPRTSVMELLGQDPTVTMLAALIALAVIFFGALTPSRFLSGETLRAMAFQMPELGILALAMMIPLMSGGLNLAIIATANLSALVLFVLCAVLVAVLGGVDPNGGFGKVLGLFLSLILLQIIATGFNLLGFSEFLTQFPKGSDVAIIEGDPGTTSSMERVTGFTNAAKEGGLNIVASQPANWNRRLPHERDSLLTSGRCRPNLTFPHSQRHMCQYSSLTFVPRGTIISHRPNFLPNTIC
jgi:hypothetical protein